MPRGRQRYSSTLLGGQHHAPAALSPGKTQYPLYRVGPRAGLDVCEKSRTTPFPRNSIPGPSSPQPVAIPTELSQPTSLISTNIKSASPTCCGTCVPPSGRTHCQFLKTKCYNNVVIYGFLGLQQLRRRSWFCVKGTTVHIL
jgi:hypothetical protein